jgi:hypothetical protein
MKRITFVVVGLLTVLAYTFLSTQTESTKTYKVAEHIEKPIPIFD